MQKGRDKGIDFLMALAVFLIVNLHFRGMWPDSLKPFATGGLIGDALFFFCSGYKLSLGRFDRFDRWYGRRILRIYPSVVIWDLIAALIFTLPITVRTLFDGYGFGGYWFLKCILIHYLLVYFIRRYLSRWVSWWFALIWVVVVSWWFIAYSQEFSRNMMSAAFKFEWTYMLLFTLLGVMVSEWKMERVRLSIAVLILSVSVSFFYGTLLLCYHYPAFDICKVSILVWLTMVILSLFALSRTEVVSLLMTGGGVIGKCLLLLGGLCLEVYISHTCLITDRFNFLFPFNVIVCFVLAVMLAYLIRCIKRVVVGICVNWSVPKLVEIVKLEN